MLQNMILALIAATVSATEQYPDFGYQHGAHQHRGPIGGHSHGGYGATQHGGYGGPQHGGYGGPQHSGYGGQQIASQSGYQSLQHQLQKYNQPSHSQSASHGPYAPSNHEVSSHPWSKFSDKKTSAPPSSYRQSTFKAQAASHNPWAQKYATPTNHYGHHDSFTNKQLIGHLTHLKQQTVALTAQVAALTDQMDSATFGPFFDFFISNPEDQMVMEGGDPSDSPFRFCVEAGTVLALQNQITVDTGTNNSMSYEAILAKDMGNDTYETVAKSSMEQVGKLQSISLIYKESVEEDTEFVLRGTNTGAAPVMIPAREGQISFQLYDADTYKLSSAFPLPSCGNDDL